jgi:hypothetical protein
MNVRLVAYRKATSDATSETAYNLDLQEAPNISLNFQFSDIKEPETRKGSFSQTFKLPFTKDNNNFFQDWYNPNISTLVYDTRTKFTAVLYIGTTPQFEGILQLKAVYRKGQYYEVVLMSNTATLFSVIGETRLKDVFLNEDGSYSDSFNHIYNADNLEYSWNGTNNNFENTAGETLRDSSVNVNKVMYPLSVIDSKFYYNPNINRYLSMSQSAINNMGYNTASFYTVNLTQFRPAIQLKTIVKLILAKAGYSYTSNFIDGDYFGKLFMTTGNHLESAAVPMVNVNNAPSGFMFVANNETFGEFVLNNDNCSVDTIEQEFILPDNTPYIEEDGMTIPSDADGIWNTTYDYFTKTDLAMQSIQIMHTLYWNNITSCDGMSEVGIAYLLQEYDPVAQELVEDSFFDTLFYNTPMFNNDSAGVVGLQNTLSLENMPFNKHAKIIVKIAGVKRDSSAANGTIRIGTVGYNNNEFAAWAMINWPIYGTNVYGGEVDIPSCIDPDLKQKDFLKDIVQRFNLVILSDPDDTTNLIIEPYSDYLAQGEVKHWTDKLDTSKEVIIKDTSDLQKKNIIFTDLEDDDIYNKEIKENYPEVNVFGHISINEWNNDNAKGELKNNPFFSPFINAQIYMNGNTQSGSYLRNMAVQYEFSVETSGEEVSNPMKKTKPKLFYYRGEATQVLDLANNQTNYYLHNHNTSTETIDAHEFNTYPVCTPFDIDTDDVATLSSSTRSLYWNSTPPIVGDLTIFNADQDSGNWFNGSLFGYYWQSYLNDIYSKDARIMEAYVNIDAVDVFLFKFNDEYFIKDTYWRILKIQNYQVGSNASTKITFIKSLDSKANCTDCDYVLGSLPSGMNMVATALEGVGFYAWCPDTDPTCEPDVESPNFVSLYTQPACCTCNGGEVIWSSQANADQGLYPCLTYSGSLPFRLANKQGLRALFNDGQSKDLLTGKIAGDTNPFIYGSGNTRYNNPILPHLNDDMIVKYKNFNTSTPPTDGESHRMVLTGYTEGTTKSYAYPKGKEQENLLNLPLNVNVILRVKGVSTVVSNTSTNHPLGTTEAFAYYTAFVIRGDTVTQLGTAGGTPEFALKEASSPVSTCTLDIDINDFELRFGLECSDSDLNRTWELSVELDINRIFNMQSAFDENYALFQNGQRIRFENNDYLVWN